MKDIARLTQTELMAQLKLRMFLSGVRLQDVAAAIGCTAPHVSAVIHGRRKNAKIIDMVIKLTECGDAKSA